MGKSTKKSAVEVAPAAVSAPDEKSGKNGKRNAEDGVEKAAKKRKTAPQLMPVENDLSKVKKQPPPKKAEISSSDDDSSDFEEEEEVLQALKKMNCFFVEKQALEYKSYHKQKQCNHNLRKIMKKLELPCPDSSDEVSENTYMTQNKYTYWFGDDASSLAPYWQGDYGQSSSGPANDGAYDDVEEDDEDDDDE